MKPLHEYYEELRKADWSYMMSDDHSVYRRGSAAMGILESIRLQSPDHRRLFEEAREIAWKEKEPDSFSPDLMEKVKESASKVDTGL